MKARTPPSTEINVSLNICSKYFRKHPQHKCQHQISKRTNIFQIFQNIKFLKRPTFTREHLGTKDRSIFLPAPMWYHGHKNMMFFCIKKFDDRNWIYPSRIFLRPLGCKHHWISMKYNAFYSFINIGRLQLIYSFKITSYIILRKSWLRNMVTLAKVCTLNPKLKIMRKSAQWIQNSKNDLKYILM